MSSTISSHWEIIHLFQKYNLRTAKKLKYCVKMSISARHTNTNRLRSYLKQLIQGHVSSWLIKKSTAIFCNDYPKPITQALISTRVPALVGRAYFQEWGGHLWENNTENTHERSLQ